MNNIVRDLETIMGNWEKMENELDYTWGDRLVDVVYYPFYYTSYLFLWLAYWIWKAIRDAYEEVWG